MAKPIRLPFELLRVYSPSAEVRGHGPGQETLQTGKRDVTITSIERVGNYALQPTFSDGHSTGLYSWDLLYDIATRQDELWREYLDKLAAAGVDRDAPDGCSRRAARALSPLIRFAPDSPAVMRAQPFRIRERTNAMSKTHFGFQTVDEQEKAQKVAGVFHSVAANYDLMNDLMSGGLHRAWKMFTIAQANVRPGFKVLDIAGGTGDLSKAFAKQAGPTGEVWHTDINESMLRVGRDRLLDKGVITPALLVRRGKNSFSGQLLRRGDGGLRTAQHDPQGCRAGGDAPRAEAGRAACWCWNSRRCGIR